MNYHVLNGDALKQYFPSELEGDIIVARECLVDGPVHGNSLQELYKTRAQYLNVTYGNHINSKYEDEVIPEFQKIENIPSGANVYLWFEEDLFCQVNLWFVIHFIYIHKIDANIQLVFPYEHAVYGFGSMNSSDLLKVFKKSICLKPFNRLNQLWPAYQNDNFSILDSVASYYENELPFLNKCVDAHKERNLTNNLPGKPEQILEQINQELNYPKFGTVFQEFCKRASVYGFGDLQVKRLYDSL